MLLTLGIESDLGLIERLTFLQEDIGRFVETRAARVRWVAPESIFLPLKFLGQQDIDSVPQLHRHILSCLKDQKAFHLGIAGLVAYPNPQAPRIIAVSCQEGLTQLHLLRELLEEGLWQNYFPRDKRPFLPYMMLGRIATPSVRIDLSDVIAALRDLHFGKSLVSELVLYGTELTDEGCDFDVLDRFPLKY